MNIENIKEKNGIYYYPTNKFATIKIKLKYLLTNNKEEIIKLNILCRYLKKTNMKYKTFKEIRDKERMLYDMKININTSFTGSKSFLNIKATLLSPRIIKDDYIKDAFNFLYEILFNPNFSNGELDKDIFNEIKKSLINEEKKAIVNPSEICKRTLLTTVVPNSNITTNTIIDIEKFTNIINNTTEKEIIDLYNKIIKESFYKGYIFGDITDDEFFAFNSLFKFKKNNKIILDYKEIQDIPYGEKEIINQDIKTSHMYVVYKLNNFDTNKIHIYKALNYILSSSIGLCYKILREERGIVYSTGAYINKFRFFGFLIILANISEENKDNCLEGIDEIFKRLKDTTIVNELLKYAKEKMNQIDYLSDENLSDNIKDLEDYVFGYKPTRLEIHTLVNSLTPQDIIDEIDNIEKRYTYFYRGTKK